MLSDVQQPAIVRELLATDAFLTQVRHRTIGVVSPHQIDPEWFLAAKEVDEKTVLEQALRKNTIKQTLQELWPKQDEYWLLIEKRKVLLEQDNTNTVVVPLGVALKKA